MKAPSLTPKNARAYFNAYMSRKEPALRELRELCEQEKILPLEQLDNSPNSLVPIWAWMRTRLKQTDEHPPAEVMPVWYQYVVRDNPMRQNQFYPQDTAFMIDRVAYYYADALQHELPDLRWQIGFFANEWNFCEPVLFSEYSIQNPVSAVVSAASLALDNDPRESPNILKDWVISAVADYEKYKAAYDKLGKHPDPRMRRKRMVFE